MHVEGLEKIQALHGWCTFEKAKAMADLIVNVQPTLSVELGVFGGRSLIAQGLALRTIGGGVVWGIDPWTKEASIDGEVGEANRDWWSKLDINSIRESAVNSVTQFGLWKWIRIIVARSEHCYELFRNIDILHIDGNHSEECSTRDVNLWVPRVRSGGYVWFDDADWPSTKLAISYMDRYCDTVHDVGGCRLFRVR